MRWLRRAWITPLLAGFLACYSPPEDPQYISDEQGRALILHGLNVSGSAKFDPDRLPFVTQADVERMAHDWGFNFARYLISWDGLEPTMGVIEQVYLDRIAERMDWFAAAGIHVVIDMHQDVYGLVDSDGRFTYGNGHPAWSFQTDGLPFVSNPLSWFFGYWQPAVMRAFDKFWDHDGHPELQDHYAAAWAAVAERFRDHPAVLGYDLMNEPWAGSTLKGRITRVEPFDAGPYRAFLERCIEAIRAVDADSWIFFEPRAWGPNDGAVSRIGKLDDPRSGDPHLVYFPHYYSVNVDAFGNYAPGSDDSLDRWAANRKAEIDLQHAPLLIGEWGTSGQTGNWREYLEDAARMADRMTSGWSYWNYSLGGWSPIDAQRSETPQADVLVRAYPQRIAGRPRFLDYDPDTRVLRFAFDEKTGVTGPSEIYVPAQRRFPNGFDVWVSDPDGSWTSSWDATREILSLWTDPATAHHEVAITPSS